MSDLIVGAVSLAIGVAVGLLLVRLRMGAVAQRKEEILEQAVEEYEMRLLAYCLMPNHWHLVLYPKHDGDMGSFMSWLTNTHTRRWHTEKKTI
ncbi:MAG: transposase, partial [Planctomycetes bacterium]|nr:transposase [Planctomycetota bacterium]